MEIRVTVHILLCSEIKKNKDHRLRNIVRFATVSMLNSETASEELRVFAELLAHVRLTNASMKKLPSEMFYEKSCS